MYQVRINGLGDNIVFEIPTGFKILIEPFEDGRKLQILRDDPDFIPDPKYKDTLDNFKFYANKFGLNLPDGYNLVYNKVLGMDAGEYREANDNHYSGALWKSLPRNKYIEVMEEMERRVSEWKCRGDAENNYDSKPRSRLVELIHQAGIEKASRNQS